jgi:hypothetical protein
MTDEEYEDFLNDNGDDRFGSIQYHVIIKPAKERKNELRKQIVIDAMSQDIINLSEDITISDKQWLVKTLNSRSDSLLAKHERRIAVTIRKILAPLIPWVLRRAAYSFPESIHWSSGFLYTIDKQRFDEYSKELQEDVIENTSFTKEALYEAFAENNGKINYWVDYKLPHYFEQGTEIKILQEHGADFLPLIDRNILKAIYHRRKMATKQLSVLTKIKKNVITYGDLLVIEPLWFDIIYKHKIEIINDKNSRMRKVE